MTTLYIRNNTLQIAKVLLHHNGRVLILTENDGSPGLPGGARDKEDADLTSTAIREVREELGLEPDAYTLQPTEITTQFTFTNTSMPERHGKAAIAHLFLAAFHHTQDISLEQTLEGFDWLNPEEAMQQMAAQKNRFAGLLERGVALLRQ
ncbi:MAG: NUDIX hydrolase [Patescibacteria group bacterium]